MLIKLKLPERKTVDSLKPISFWDEEKQEKILGNPVIPTKSINALIFNQAIDEISSLNQPLVRGMEIDIEAFAKDMFEVCVYPGLEKWEEQTNHIKTRWRTNAEIIRDNAHVWLKEKDSK